MTEDSTNFHYDTSKENYNSIQDNPDQTNPINNCKKKSRIPIHNKFRLVYRYDSSGEPVSFIHINKRMALRIILIAKYLHNLPSKDCKVTLEKMYNEISKHMKISRSTLLNTVYIISGLLCIDIRDEQGYRKVLNSVININQGLYNKKRNLPKCPPYLKAPIYLSLART